MPKSELIEIEINDERKTVKRGDYVTAKTKTLKEFGYTTLTYEEVDKQLEIILSGDDTGLNVIGHFIKDDIIGRAE